MGSLEDLGAARHMVCTPQNRLILPFRSANNAKT